MALLPDSKIFWPVPFGRQMPPIKAAASKKAARVALDCTYARGLYDTHLEECAF